MLFKKSAIDQMTLKDVMDVHVKIYQKESFDLQVVTSHMVSSHQKFSIIQDHDKMLILSNYDLLSLHLSDHLDDIKKWHKPLKGRTLVKDFIYHEASYRYYCVAYEGEIGFVDRHKVEAMYHQVDEDNSALITSILDNIHMAICIVDTACRVRFWNKSAEKLYEISREAMYGEVLTNHFPTALLPEVLKNEKQFIDVYNSPKESCHNLISASPLYNNDTLIGAISYDKDISEQIKIAEDLKQTESNLRVLERKLDAYNEQFLTFETIVGNDPSWLEVKKLTQMVSESMINILIAGESGTGKEVLARAIHIESKRSGQFVAINCSAIPRDLFESELFGYAAGAFTGALKQGKIGRFEYADKGTLFLDEIGDMPLEMQAKLLRVLEDGEVMPVGGNKSKRVEVRIVAASNKDLQQLCQVGKFRKDLYYRLNGIGVQLTPLRERPEDIELIGMKFFNDFKAVYNDKTLKMPHGIMTMLKTYTWEGNIRELRNIIERLVILSKNHGSTEVEDRFLPDVIRNMAAIKNVSTDYSLKDLLEKTEKDAIMNALLKSHSKAEAAKILNIPRSTLYFKMDKYGINDVSEN